MKKNMKYSGIFFVIFGFICAYEVHAQQSIFRKVRTVSDNKGKALRQADGSNILQTVSARRAPNKISSIDIPEDIGIVKDSFRGTENKVIIHIQDAHCNLEAQENIAKIIGVLVEKHNLRLIAVEGSEGIIDVTPFSSFPDEKVKREVSEFFMSKGRITGPEHFAITSGKDVELYGIELKTRYMDNLNAFKKTMPYRPKFKAAVTSIMDIFAKLKPKMYNRHLLALDVKLRAYESEKITFSKYCEHLIFLAEKRGLDVQQYDNLKHFAIVAQLENKVDFDKVDQERNAIFEIFSRKKMSRKYESELRIKTINYKNGKLTAGEYHAYVVKLAKGRKIDMTNYQNLVMYTSYMNAYEAIDHDKLLKERDILEEDIKATMYENLEQKMLSDLDKTIKKIDGFHQLEMSRDDLQYYYDNQDLFSFSKFLSFIGTYAPRYNIAFDIESNLLELDAHYSDFEEYYRYAKERDTIMNEKTLERMEALQVTIAVQVCGGFHTDGMMRALKKQNISFLVLAPRITKEDPNNPYLDILLNRTSPFDDLFEANRNENE